MFDQRRVHRKEYLSTHSILLCASRVQPQTRLKLTEGRREHAHQIASAPNDLVQGSAYLFQQRIR